MKRNRFNFLLLPLLLLVLTSCGEAEEPEKPEKEIFYIPEDIQFTSDLDIYNCCISGDYIYLSGLDYDYNDRIQRLPAQGGEGEDLPEYQPALSTDKYGGGIQDLRGGEDGSLWVLENYVPYGTNDRIYVLRQLDGDGSELARWKYATLDTALGIEDDDQEQIMLRLLMDRDGDIFAETRREVTMLTQEGAVQFTIEKENLHYGYLVRLSDGRCAMYHQILDEEGTRRQALSVIDKEAGELGEETYLLEGSSPYPKVYDGSAEALFYYIGNDTLYAWKEGAQESTKILYLPDAGVPSDGIYIVSALSDGQVALQCLLDGSPAFIALTPSDTPPPEKKVLTYATLRLWSAQRGAIAAFNRSSQEYRIEVTDYSQYGDYDAALSRLTTEINAGNIPDILDLRGVPVARWAASGLLEDLWPYIDGDSELSRDSLMERVLQAAEIGGKLYEVGPKFTIQTLIGRKDVVGDRMSWTGADMWEALESMPKGCLPTRDGQMSMLSRVMGLNWRRFIDWEAGACDFTCDEFKALLEFCAGFPAETTRGSAEKAVYVGRQMLYNGSAGGFYSIQQMEFFLGGGISYVGYPNEWGEVGSSFALSDSVAMTTACEDKEGAWSFLRTLLLPQGEELVTLYMDSGGFPINKADFQVAAELAMTKEYETDYLDQLVLDENGEPVERRKTQIVLLDLGVEIDIYALRQEEYDQIMALYNAVDAYSRWDPDLEPIVEELAGAYFAGDKSLEETVELIQRRATLYVGEHT